MPLARFALFVYLGTTKFLCSFCDNMQICSLQFFSFCKLVWLGWLCVFREVGPCIFLQTRPAALAALETVGLTGRGGALSHTSPGVFLQVRSDLYLSVLELGRLSCVTFMNLVKHFRTVEISLRWDCIICLCL